MSPRNSSPDDLQVGENLKRIDDLESFRKELEGKEFDKKILQSIKDSTPIRNEIEQLAWKANKNKIIWIVLGGCGVIFIDLILRAIPSILKTVAGN